MKTSRFTVKHRVNKNRPPKFGLNNDMLRARKRVLGHNHRSQSPRRATLIRYNMRRPEDDYDIIRTPRQHGRFRVVDIEYNPKKVISNPLLQTTGYRLNDDMLQARKRVLKHKHRSQSPRRATLKRYNIGRSSNDFDIINTPRQQGRYNVIDIEPLHRDPRSPTLTMKQNNKDDENDEGERVRRSSSSKKKRKTRK
jgi:hypothetical protein